MKKITIHTLLKLFALLIVLSGCAVTNKYGPYMGKVVDKETNTPLEGAVVFMKFTTAKANMGGGSYSFYDAIETLTDSKGEFLIDPARAWRKSDIWESWEDGRVIIFKPGYGAYPRHRDSGPLFMPNGSLPSNEFVTIKLPKLETIEERRRNLGNIPNINAPDNKYPKLKGLESVETDFVYRQFKKQ